MLGQLQTSIVKALELLITEAERNDPSSLKRGRVRYLCRCHVGIMPGALLPAKVFVLFAYARVRFVRRSVLCSLAI